ncbi:MAG: MDR family MFS transporter [Micromonosporaceae bacterium]
MAGVRRWWGANVGGLPGSFWYLWLGTLISRASAFVIIVLAFYLVQERGFSAAFAGLVFGLFGAGNAFGVLVGGVLADRWGRRATALTGHLASAVVLVALGLAVEPVAIAALATLLGFVSNLVRPAFGAMMADIVPPTDRLRAFSLNYWAINVGFSIAAILAGMTAGVSYLLLFLVDAAGAVLTGLVIFLKVPETRPAVPAPVQGEAAPGGTMTVFRDGVFMGFVGLTLVTSLVFMQHISTLPVAMQLDGLSAATYGWVIALNGILIVAGQLFVPRLINGRSRTGVLAVAALVMAVGFGLTAYADAAWLYAITVLVWTLGEMLQSPSNSTLIADLSPAALRGRYQGVFSLAFSGAAFAAPILGGYVLQDFGSTTLWLGCTALGVLAAAGYLATGPARERRAALLRAEELSPAPAAPRPAPEPVAA